MSFTMNQASTTTKPETFMLSAEQLDSLPAEAKAALEQVDDLKYFLATAPANWQVDQIIRRYLLPTGEYVSCVLWRNLFHVTGTDIVRALTYRFQAFGRPVRNVKKFEEGIFSDLRNLKPGTDASLEEPKSAFLDLLYKNNCIRTQKKQKVFYWFSVPHDRLFLDALERDLKRERMGTETTTEAVQEPALSFVFDATQSLYEQLTKSLQQNAASEVGATLAAQQAQHNLMSGQYPGAVQTYPSGPHYSPRVGPSESYHRRSQSIQSAVPIDYRNQSNDAPQPPIYQTGPLGFEVHHTTPVHAITNDRAARSTSFRDFPSYMNSGTSFPVEDAYRRRALSFDRSVESSYSMPLESGIYEMNRDLSTSNVIQAPMIGNSYGNSMDTFGTHDFQVPVPQQGPAYSETNDGFAGPYDIPGDFLGLQGENNNFSIPPRVPMNFGLPVHFSPFEGSPTYKQRRRRQSIPSSLLLAEQAAQAQQRQRAATEPHQLDKTIYQINDAGSTATAGLPQAQLDGHAAPVDVAPNFTGYGENLSYQYDDRIAELEQNISRVGSDSDIGSPYPTKSYNCPIPGCERLFKRLEHLKRHVRTHTQERPYECEICDKRFSRSDNLAQHRKTHERGSSSSSSAAPEFRNANFYKDRRFGKKSETPSHYDSLELDCDAEQQWQNRRIDSYNPDRRLPILESGGPHRTFDPTAFSLDHCPEEVQESICLDPVQFHESLNPPSPRSLPNPHVCRSESSSGHCDITPLDSISVFSTASEVSQAYVPVAVSSSELYASRKHALTESWVDDEATPRQERFSLAETFSIPREISDMRQSTNGQLSWS